MRTLNTLVVAVMNFLNDFTSAGILVIILYHLKSKRTEAASFSTIICHTYSESAFYKYGRKFMSET